MSNLVDFRMFWPDGRRRGRIQQAKDRQSASERGEQTTEAGAGVIFPSGLRDHEYRITGWSGAPAGFSAFVHGCFAYKTALGMERKSEYCFILPDADIGLSSIHCPWGNDAD